MTVIKQIVVSFVKQLFSMFGTFGAVKLIEKALASTNKSTSSFNIFYKMRFWEALQGPADIVVTGDSIIHFGEAIIEKKLPVKVTAIGGDNVDSLEKRLKDNVLIFRPKRVIIHCGGNSFLGGKSVDYIAEKLILIITRLKMEGVKVAYIEVTALGNPMTSVVEGIREKANEIVSINAVGVDKLSSLIAPHAEVIRIRKPLNHVHEGLQGSDGWIKDKYKLPDCIHINERAYHEVIVPAIDDYLARAK